jgi:hypothetical protein
VVAGGQPQNKQHCVGMDEIIPTVKGQQMFARPVPPAALGDFHVPLCAFQAGKRRDDDEEHSISEGVLMDLVSE